MCFTMRKVATEGCEILNDDGEIIGWSVNGEWGRQMVEGLDIIVKQEEEMELEEING